MINYKKKYPATKNGKQVRTGDSIPISSLTEKTDTINNFEFLALDDTNLNQSLKLNLAEHSKQIGEANKVIDSNDIVVSEEIDNDLGKTQRLSFKNKIKKDIMYIDWRANNPTITLTQEDLDTAYTIFIDVVDGAVDNRVLDITLDRSTANNKFVIDYSNYGGIVTTEIFTITVKINITQLQTFYVIPPNYSSGSYANYFVNCRDYFDPKKIEFRFERGRMVGLRGIYGFKIFSTSPPPTLGFKLPSTEFFYTGHILKNKIFFIDTSNRFNALVQPATFYGFQNITSVSLILDGKTIFKNISSTFNAFNNFYIRKGNDGTYQPYQTVIAYSTSVQNRESYSFNPAFATTQLQMSVTAESVDAGYFFLVVLYHDGEGF